MVGYQGCVRMYWRWSLLGLTFPFVLIRAYIQIRFNHRPWREIIVVLAWLLFLGNTICDAIEVHWGWWNPDFPDLYREHSTQIFKIEWAYSWMYLTSIYLCKIVLLFLFMDLTNRRFHPKTWWLIVFCWVSVVGGLLEHVLFRLFSCWPISLAWSDPNGSKCVSTPWSTSTGIHFITDVFIFIVPFIVLRNVKTVKTRQKLAAYAMFGLGFLNIISALILFLVWVVPGANQTNWWEGWTAAADWCMPFQQATAILIVCLPYARRLWQGTSPEAMRNQRERLNGSVVRRPQPTRLPPSSLDLEAAAPIVRMETEDASSEKSMVFASLLSSDTRSPRSPNRFTI